MSLNLGLYDFDFFLICLIKILNLFASLKTVIGNDLLPFSVFLSGGYSVDVSLKKKKKKDLFILCV